MNSYHNSLTICHSLIILQNGSLPGRELDTKLCLTTSRLSTFESALVRTSSALEVRAGKMGREKTIDVSLSFLPSHRPLRRVSPHLPRLRGMMEIGLYESSLW